MGERGVGLTRGVGNNCFLAFSIRTTDGERSAFGFPSFFFSALFSSSKRSGLIIRGGTGGRGEGKGREWWRSRTTRGPVTCIGTQIQVDEEEEKEG